MSSTRTLSKVSSEIETPSKSIRCADAVPELNDTPPTWPSSWRAYFCLFGGFLLMFNSWGLVNAYGTYASYYMQNLLPGRPLYQLSLVGSTESFVVLISSIGVGRLLDAGYSRYLIVAGTVLVSLGSFLLSVVNGDQSGNYGLIWLVQGLVSGLGMACFFVSSSQVVATWFQAKKAFAIGIVASGASIAGLLYPLMLRALISSQGFDRAQRWVSTLTLLTSCIAIIAAVPNPAHTTRRPPRWLSWDVFVDRHAFRNPAFAWFTLSIAFMFFGFYAIFFTIEQWAISHGFGYRQLVAINAEAGLPAPLPDNAIESFWLLAFMNGSSTLGRLVSAYFSDSLGALPIHACSMAAASLLVLLFWPFATTLPAGIAFVVLFGAVSGAVIGLPPASVAYILGLDPAQQAKLGQWTGMMYSCAAPFALTGPLIASYLVDRYDTFLTNQMWSGVCLGLAAMCAGMALWVRRRRAGAPRDEEGGALRRSEDDASHAEKSGSVS